MNLPDPHCQWSPTPNLYIERDLGPVWINFPEHPRLVPTKLVTDTAGMCFLAFDHNVPLY